MRHYAYILNPILQQDLKEMDDSMVRVRNRVKYAKSFLNGWIILESVWLRAGSFLQRDSYNLMCPRCGIRHIYYYVGCSREV